MNRWQEILVIVMLMTGPITQAMADWQSSASYYYRTGSNPLTGITEQKAIRAEYTDTVRRRGSKVAGGGGFGRFLRNMQTISNDSARRELANALAPLENTKQRIELAMTASENAIAQLEARWLIG